MASYGEVLAANIRAARSRADLSQQDVAERMRALGHDAWLYQTVGHVEKGRRRLTAEELLGLSYALGTMLASLIPPTADDKTVEFPSGASVAVASVQRSAAGIPDDAITWKGNVPVFTEPGQLTIDLASLDKRTGVLLDGATVAALDKAAASGGVRGQSARQTEDEPDGG